MSKNGNAVASKYEVRFCEWRGLNCYDLKVIEVVTEQEYKNAMVGGRSIRIDIYAKDAEDKVYDIEVQRASEGANPRRARFHSSMIDSRMLKEGQDFKEIHDSYVIFITEDDVLGIGYSLYHIDRTIQENGNNFGDGSHIIYVNGSYENDTDPVGRLMHDFRCENAEDMFYQPLAKSVRHFKETQGGKKTMGMSWDECVKIQAKWEAEKLLRENGDKIVREIAKNIAEDMVKNKSEDMAKDKSEDMVKDKSEDMVKDKSEDMVKEIAKDMAKEIAGKIAKDKNGEIVKTMLADGELSIEKIAKYTNFSIDEIKEFEKELMVSEE